MSLVWFEGYRTLHGTTLHGKTSTIYNDIIWANNNNILQFIDSCWKKFEVEVRKDTSSTKVDLLLLSIYIYMNTGIDIERRRAAPGYMNIVGEMNRVGTF